jgi:DNA-binding response OmpR family regulator
MTASKPSVVLVDDDAALAGLLREFLELQGMQVAVLHTAEAALARIATDRPDILVLDVMLPGISGIEALRKLRAQHDLPVIMLTARGAESDRIVGLLEGADDYLAKPCNPLELAVRIRTVLKRARVASPTGAAVIDAGELHFDTKRREVRTGDRLVVLTAAEMRVLEQLMLRPGEVLTRARLTQLALDRPIEAYDRSIDTLVSKLRRKLESAGLDGQCIGGLRGQGYVLNPSRARTKTPP